MNRTTMTYREAVREAMREAMVADPRVFLMGEDVGAYGGCYAVSAGMLDEAREEARRLVTAAAPLIRDPPWGRARADGQK